MTAVGFQQVEAWQGGVGEHQILDLEVVLHRNVLLVEQALGHGQLYAVLAEPCCGNLQIQRFPATALHTHGACLACQTGRLQPVLGLGLRIGEVLQPGVQPRAGQPGGQQGPGRGGAGLLQQVRVLQRVLPPLPLVLLLCKVYLLSGGQLVSLREVSDGRPLLCHPGSWQQHPFCGGGHEGGEGGALPGMVRGQGLAEQACGRAGVLL